MNFRPSLSFSSIQDVLADLRQGRMIILLDSPERENEGDLVMLADRVTPASVNFMLTHARGMLCVALSHEQVENLQLPLMVTSEQNQTKHKTAFTVTIESAVGVTTGISARDRAKTILVAADPNSRRKDYIIPGHVFPLRAHAQGLKARQGHTEAGVELAQRANSGCAAVLCEILNEHGESANSAELAQFALKHDLKVASISDLIKL
jgi:3,4-dihydroxy 2-butanone 4-phosphate synthase / GTP cyclohydrolase II